MQTTILERKARLLAKLETWKLILLKRVEENPADTESAELAAIVDKEIRDISAMQEPEFWQHYKDSYAKAVTVKLVLLFLFLLPLSLAAQSPPLGPTVPDELVKVFINARCSCSATDTLTLSPIPQNDGKPFPNSYRSDFVNAVYTEADGIIPFQMYYSPDVGQQLTFHAKGFCRHISLLIPMPRPGFYFVRFFHQGKPALIEIDARKSTIYVKAYGKCEIHE